MCNSCQACDNSAKGYATSSAHSGGEFQIGLIAWLVWPGRKITSKTKEGDYGVGGWCLKGGGCGGVGDWCSAY